MADAPGLVWQVEECLHVHFYVPPIVLADGMRVPLRDAQMMMPPVRFLVAREDGTLLKAIFYTKEMRWEIEDEDASPSGG